MELEFFQGNMIEKHVDVVVHWVKADTDLTSCSFLSKLPYADVQKSLLKNHWKWEFPIGLKANKVEMSSGGPCFKFIYHAAHPEWIWIENNLSSSVEFSRLIDKCLNKASLEGVKEMIFTQLYACSPSTADNIKRHVMHTLVSTIWDFKEHNQKTSLKKVSIVLEPEDMTAYEAVNKILEILGLEENPEIINRLCDSDFTQLPEPSSRDRSTSLDMAKDESVNQPTQVQFDKSQTKTIPEQTQNNAIKEVQTAQTDAENAPTNTEDTPTDTVNPPTDAVNPPTDAVNPPTDAENAPTDVHNKPTDAQNVPTDIQSAQTDAKREDVLQSEESRHTIGRHKDDTGGTLSEMKVLLIAGDITKRKVDAIVNSTNRRLDLSVGQVSKAIADAGGDSLQCAIDGFRKENPQGMTSPLAVTDAGDLPCSKIFHVSLPAAEQEGEKKLREVIEMCLICSYTREMHSIAFPLLGGGILRYPLNVIAKAFVETIWSFRSIHRQSCVRLVEIIVDICNTEFREYFAIEKQKMESTQAIPFEITENQLQAVLVSGDLVKQSVDALVIPCSPQLEAKTSVAKAVRLAAGETVTIELRGKRHLKDWLFAVTSGGNLNVSYIYHVNIPKYSSETVKQEDFENMINRCLTDACLINCTRVAFTVPVTKDLKYPHRETAIWFKSGFNQFRRSHSDLLFFEMKVVIKQHDTYTYEAFKEVQFDTTPIDFNQLPKTWSSMEKNETVITVELRSNEAEYKEVAELVKSVTNKFQIKKIERIQNKALYLQYSVKRWQLSQKYCYQLIERRLWHGTTEDAVESINHHGFNRSYCGKNETRFGQGVYFAEPLRFALDNRYSTKGKSRLKHVYLSEVLVGRFTVGDQTTRVLPSIDPANPHQLYDSTVNKSDNPTVFVIYNDTQAYPQYLLTLK